MPVTKTAKRALRSSLRKKAINQSIRRDMEIALRVAQKSKKVSEIKKAISLVDRAAKKKIIHKNKASRIKSNLTKKSK
jgi:small subunit ribosomal protein S20